MNNGHIRITTEYDLRLVQGPVTLVLKSPDPIT